MESVRVLFVCAANDCLSPMAEGFLRRYGGPQFEVMSAGVWPRPLDRMIRDMMQRAGIDISAHQPTALADVADHDFDFVINLSEDSRDAVTGVTNTHRLIHWRFSDPRTTHEETAEGRRRFQRIRDEVAGRVRLFAYAQSRRRDRRTGAISLVG